MYAKCLGNYQFSINFCLTAFEGTPLGVSVDFLKQPSSRTKEHVVQAPFGLDQTLENALQSLIAYPVTLDDANAIWLHLEPFAIQRGLENGSKLA